VTEPLIRIRNPPNLMPRSPDTSTHEMPAYTYALSLRIWHPRLTIDEITAALSLPPRVARAANTSVSVDPATSEPPPTFWTTDLDHPPDADLGQSLRIIASRFERSQAFFQMLHDTGGRAEIFVGWFINGNTGDVLPPGLLGALAALHLDLALDIYPPDQAKTQPSASAGGSVSAGPAATG